MQHPFPVLAGEYASLLARMVITRADDAHRAAQRLLQTKFHFIDVSAKMGVPMMWGMASFEREASSDFRLSPAQGDPWDRKSVNAPRDLGPYASWEAAAEAAYHIDGLDAVGAKNWIWARACYEGELFNGFGPRLHGIHTGYLWSGTNIYDCGKYTSDGYWDPDVRDEQLGIIPLMVMLLALDPSLALADELPAAAKADIVAPQPVPLGHGGGDPGHDTFWIQASLNIVMGAGLEVDSNFGRVTRRAVVAFQQSHGLEPDGLVGPLTIQALLIALQTPA